MRMLAIFVLAAGVLAGTGSAEAQRREMGAHEHGRGTLDIAIEGIRVAIELEVPAADIVGFEHKARTRQQKAAVDKAKEQLAQPLALFRLPERAGCRVSEAKVDMEHGHPKPDKGAAAKDKADAEDRHSEVRAHYSLECASAAAIDAIEFPYFKAFAGARRLDVTVVTAKGQSKFTVTREKPRLSLAGMM